MKLKYFIVLAFAAHQSAIAAQQFATPEAAGNALVQALEQKNTAKIEQIFGSLDLVQSGDDVADANQVQQFIANYRAAHQWKATNDRQQVLEVGRDLNPFAIPLVRKNSQWQFDTKAGREEIISRRIGLNELSTIEAIKSYGSAQHEYYLSNPDRSQLLHYADRLTSSPDRRDGLYWTDEAGAISSPLGAFFAKASQEGYTKNNAPYHGYYFKVLKQQGPAANGGAYSYVENGKMFGGYAIVAWPANYGRSGVMSFISNQDGIIYQRNLGKNTAEAAKNMQSFNPDKGWEVVE